MLTKDLVRFKAFKGELFPLFINAADEALLSVAEQLIDVFKTAVGKTRVELLDDTQLIVENAPTELLIVRGLEKLLLDRTEFNAAPDDELTAFRQKILTRSSQLLSSFSMSETSEYQQQLAREFHLSPVELAARLYADLPDYQPVLSFRTLSAERLLHRYNCALVQGLLLHCQQLRLSVADTRPAVLRQIFKYMRFHQLLADIQKTADGYRIVVDGPRNLFYQTKKYGLSLAQFFPAALQLERWQLEADVQLNNKRSQSLRLDQNSCLKPYSRHFFAYIPEEMQLFQSAFDQQAPDWKVQSADDFVPLPGEFYCFPDYLLTHKSGVSIAVELFHPWHAAHLTHRLQQLADVKRPIVIIGVSTALARHESTAGCLEQSAYFSKYGFIFNQMPTVNKLLPILGLLTE